MLIGHSPALEQQFVRDGFSYEPIGRTVDVERLRGRRPGRATRRASCAPRATTPSARSRRSPRPAPPGRANFVSRGDNSGTNTKEKDIWGLSRVARDARDEPVGGQPGLVPQGRARDGRHAAPHAAVPVRRRRLLHDHRPRDAAAADDNRAITALQTVMDDQSATRARRREPHAQRLQRLRGQPGEVPGGRTCRARWRSSTSSTSHGVPGRARAASRRGSEPGFFPAAFPRVKLSRRPRGAPSPRGSSVTLCAARSPPRCRAPTRSRRDLATARALPTPRQRRSCSPATGASTTGAFRLRTRLTRSGTLFLHDAAVPQPQPAQPVARARSRCGRACR